MVEAVACYRSGAYRSTIVATWIAVCYDVIDKLRELALSGDAAAQQHIDKLEQARASGDIEQSLRFERGILTLAQDQFAFITPLEFMDLWRLQEDRNRCAHPSLITLEQGFSPSAELARMHIRSAVMHLLQHQPVQGKAALERLINEVNSEYFPKTAPKAAKALTSGPLKRPRESLIRNFLVVLLKEALTTDVDWKREHRIFAAVGAVKLMHSSSFESVLAEILPQIFRNIPESLLNKGVSFLVEFGDYWHVLTPDLQLKLEAYVEALPHDVFHLVNDIIEYGPLKRQAEHRIKIASDEDIRHFYFMFDKLSLPVADRCIELYLRSWSADEANKIASSIKSNCEHFSADQIRKLLVGIKDKDELLRSLSLSSTINALHQTKIVEDSEFRRILDENGLSKFMYDDDIPF